MDFNPFSNIRNSLQNVQAHPFQSLMRGFAGAVNPGLGFAAGRGFDAYNNRQFNNAADASALCDSNFVMLEVRRHEQWLEWIVRDRGPGFTPAGTTAAIGISGKQSGLGIGLALAEATAERLTGELIATNTGNGAEMCLRLPLSAIVAN